MSAIWGFVDFSKRKLDSNLQNNMEEPFHKYKIDRYERKLYDNVLMGCGIQNVTKESENEILPIFDYKRNIFFTADCIIDNRTELIQQLGEEYGCDSNTPDGSIIFASYLKWGEECAKHLRGIFSFAIYDANNETLFLYADQVSERCIYYYTEENRIYFSTLIHPIVKALGDKVEINDEYITDSLGLFGLRISVESTYTPCKGIVKVEAGCYIKRTKNSVQIVRYWSPLDNKNFPAYQSPEKSGEYCRKLLEVAVEDALRCNGNIGAALSSGLDSSTICGIAARKLRDKGGKLSTYTFVPVPDYQFTGEGYYIADETPGVKKIVEMHSNIEPQFLDNQGSNAYIELDYFLDILEIPYKSIANLPSINRLYNKAGKDGCNIFLYAQYGNATISQGKLQDAVYDKVKHFHLMKALQLISSFGKKYHVPRKQLLKQLSMEHILFPINKIKYRFSGNILGDTFVNQEIALKMGSERKIRKRKYNMKGDQLFDINSYHKNMYDLTILSQSGELNTKFGLANGIVLRDPTKDIRIIEYCSSLPMECFFHNGLGRWLVRGNMSNYVPDEILLDVYHRGLQSADYLYNIKKSWNEVFNDMRKCCNKPKIQKYINTEKVDDFFNANEEIDQESRGVLNPVLYIVALSKFMEKYNK